MRRRACLIVVATVLMFTVPVAHADVYVWDQINDAFSSGLVQNVRLGTIDGSILGTSESVTLPDGFDEVTTSGSVRGPSRQARST